MQRLSISGFSGNVCGYNLKRLDKGFFMLYICSQIMNRTTKYRIYMKRYNHRHVVGNWFNILTKHGEYSTSG